MTVLENLQMGVSSQADARNFEGDLARWPAPCFRASRSGSRAARPHAFRRSSRCRHRARAHVLSKVADARRRPSLRLAPLIVQADLLDAGRAQSPGHDHFRRRARTPFHALTLAHRAYVLVNGVHTSSGTRRRSFRRGRRSARPISRKLAGLMGGNGYASGRAGTC